MTTGRQINCATLIHFSHSWYATGLAKYLAGLLVLMVAEYHVRILADFVQSSEITTAMDADIFIDFNIVPFFTRVSRDETLQLLEQQLKYRILAVCPRTFCSMESSATNRRA